MSADRTHDGGAAFPLAEPSGPCSVAPGMSLRDYFAAAALQGAAANPQILETFRAQGEPGQTLAIWLAPTCYAMADAMLSARGAE